MRLGVSGFDAMIIADGSGTVADKPGGSFARLIEPGIPRQTDFFSAFSHATNNAAELQPVLHALWWLSVAGQWQGPKPPRIVVVSDSEVVVKGGRREYARNANRALWAALDYYEDYEGFRVDWRWVPRNSHPLHERADASSREARLLMEQFLRETGTTGA
jgi:ribonuclease HI